MNMHDIHNKILEISELFGDLYGSYEYELVSNIMEAAFELRLLASHYELFASQHPTVQKESPEDIIYRFSVQVDENQSEAYLKQAHRLENEIAPNVLALARTMEIWVSDGSSVYDEYSSYALRKEEIRDYLVQVDDGLPVKCAEDIKFFLSAWDELYHKAGREFETISDSEKIDLSNLISIFDQAKIKTQARFSNIQEWEIVQILVDGIRNFRDEAENDSDRAKKHEAAGRIEYAKYAKQRAIERLEHAASLQHCAIEVLRTYRITSHCLWLTFKESESDDGSADVFGNLASYLTQAWDAMLKRARFLIQPMIELNELKIKAIVTTDE